MSGTRESLWHITYKAFQVFKKERNLNRYSATFLVKKAFPSVAYKFTGFVKVKRDKSS